MAEREQKARALTPNQRKRRQRILAATRELVGELGYDGTIMRDVAVRARVSPTTLYNLYNTKDELLLAALREEVTRSMQQAMEQTEGPGYARLLHHLHHVASQTREAPAFVEAITRALLQAKAGDPLVEFLLHRTRVAVQESLTAMAERQELEPGTDTGDAAIALGGAFWASFLLWNKGMIDLDALETFLMRSYLSVLIPMTRGRAKTDLEARYRALAG
jgi:AcrR family transcriptional regulator